VKPLRIGAAHRSWLIGIALSLALGMNVYLLLPYFSTEVLNFDPATYYLPYARMLLRDGLAFLATEESVRYPPLAYAYPALFGAQPVAIKTANIVLSCGLIPIFYRIGYLLHPQAGGVLAAFLVAWAPAIKPFVPTVLTEPLFLFLLGVWFWGFAEIVVAHNRWFVPVAGLAFGLAILTRGTFIYFLYLLVALSALMALAPPARRQPTARRLLLAHGLALLFPLAFSLKNWVLFDFPFFATGAGTALYLGNHPLVNGYEPQYYGLDYDDRGVTRGLDHLSIAGDKMLRGVALEMLRDRPLADVVHAYWQKTMAFLFVTKVVLPDTLWNLRSLRITELTLGVIGLLSVRNRAMQWLLGGVLGYQITVHIPLLYQHRYSVGALDLWLALLAALGLAALFERWRKQHSSREAIGTLLLIAVAIGVGDWYRKYSAPVEPNLAVTPHERIWTWQPSRGAMFQGGGIARVSPGRYRLTDTSGYVDIPIRDVLELSELENYVLSVELSVIQTEPAATCGEARAYFRRTIDPEFTAAQSAPLQIHPDGVRRSHHIGATLRLSLKTEGDLRLVVNCSPGTIVELAEVYVSEPRVASTYRQAYLDRIAGQQTDHR